MLLSTQWDFSIQVFFKLYDYKYKGSGYGTMSTTLSMKEKNCRAYIDQLCLTEFLDFIYPWMKMDICFFSGQLHFWSKTYRFFPNTYLSGTSMGWYQPRYLVFFLRDFYIPISFICEGWFIFSSSSIKSITIRWVKQILLSLQVLPDTSFESLEICSFSLTPIWPGAWWNIIWRISAAGIWSGGLAIEQPLSRITAGLVRYIWGYDGQLWTYFMYISMLVKIHYVSPDQAARLSTLWRAHSTPSTIYCWGWGKYYPVQYPLKDTIVLKRRSSRASQDITDDMSEKRHIKMVVISKTCIYWHTWLYSRDSSDIQGVIPLINIRDFVGVMFPIGMVLAGFIIEDT